MAILEAELKTVLAPKLLTYETYLSEGVVYGRYEIIDGVRHFMPNPAPLRQEISMTISEHLRAWQRRTKLGRTFMAPRDVLVRVKPDANAAAQRAVHYKRAHRRAAAVRSGSFWASPGTGRGSPVGQRYAADALCENP